MLKKEFFGQKKEQQDVPQTVEEAVRLLVSENNLKKAADYLRNNRNEITEFCLQVIEYFKEGDLTGCVYLARLIKSLL